MGSTTAGYIIERVRKELEAAETVAGYRLHKRAFTRRCKLTFERVAVMILRGHKMSIQNGLNKVFGAIKATFEVVSAGAYCHARQKLNPELFAHLNRMVGEDFYRLSAADETLKHWHGHRLIGMDGLIVTLPDTPETRSQYSIQTNQHVGSLRVQALAGVTYDLLNELGLGISMGKRQAEKNLLMSELWSSTQVGDVLVMDRHYGDYGLLAWLMMQGRHAVIRLQTGRFKACQAFWTSTQAEQIVDLDVPASAREFVRQHHLPESIRVRLIRVLLDTGETEVLITTLLDSVRYPATEFKQVYGWRWHEETFFDRLKHIFDLERFSGTSALAINQDVQGIFFLASLESILIKVAQDQLHLTALQKSDPISPQVNRSVSYVALLDRIVPLLLSSLDTPSLLLELQHLFQTNPTRPRPDRHVPRPKFKPSRRLHFLRYLKRIPA